LYAEIASIEEQHVTQYESIIDPDESWLEKWVLHEAMEVYNYYSCTQSETNPRIRDIWTRFLDYELGHLNMAVSARRRWRRSSKWRIARSRSTTRACAAGSRSWS
jgi:hypothetical protein